MAVEWTHGRGDICRTHVANVFDAAFGASNGCLLLDKTHDDCLTDVDGVDEAAKLLMGGEGGEDGERDRLSHKLGAQLGRHRVIMVGVM